MNLSQKENDMITTTLSIILAILLLPVALAILAVFFTSLDLAIKGTWKAICFPFKAIDQAVDAIEAKYNDLVKKFTK